MGISDKFNRAASEEDPVSLEMFNMNCEHDFNEQEKPINCNRKCYSDMFTIQDPKKIGKLFPEKCEGKRTFSIGNYGQDLNIKIGDKDIKLSIK